MSGQIVHGKIEAKAYFKNPLRSGHIGIPEADIPRAPAHGPGAAPITFQNRNFYMPPGAIWFDQLNGFQIMKDTWGTHMFVTIDDEKEAEEIRVKNPHVAIVRPQNKQKNEEGKLVDAGPVLNPRTGKPVIGFFNPTLVLLDVSKKYQALLESHTDLVAAHEHIEGLKALAGETEELRRKAVVHDSEMAASRSEIEALKRKLAAVEAAGIIEGKRK